MLFGGCPDDAGLLVELWRQAEGPALHLERRCSQAPSPADVADATLHERIAERRRRRTHTEQIQRALSTSLKQAVPPTTGPPGGAKWPTRLRRSLALAGSATARETAEGDQRNRWVREVRAIVVAAGLPVTCVSSHGSALQDVARNHRQSDGRSTGNNFGQEHGCRNAIPVLYILLACRHAFLLREHVQTHCWREHSFVLTIHPFCARHNVQPHGPLHLS